jgi:hypothetical protein
LIKRERLLRAENTEAQGVKSGGANVVSSWCCETRQLFAQITSGSPRKGRGENPLRNDFVLQEACDSPHHRERLAGARAGKYVEDAGRVGGYVAMRSCDAVVPSHHSAAV